MPDDYMPALKAPVVAVIGALLVLLGGWDVPMQALAVLQVLDLASGIAKGFATGQLSSQRCGRGVARKLLMWMLVALAVQVDRLLGEGHEVRNVALVFWCVTEGVSILENAAAAGLPVPPILRQALERLRGVANIRLAEPEARAVPEEHGEGKN